MCSGPHFIKVKNSKGEEVVFGGVFSKLTLPGYGRVEIEELSRRVWRDASRNFGKINEGLFGPYFMTTGEIIVIRIKGDYAFVIFKDPDGKDVDWLRMPKGTRVLRNVTQKDRCPECKSYDKEPSGN